MRRRAALSQLRHPQARAGGHRTIGAPDDTLKEIQRRTLHRGIHGLRVHAAVHGFEEGRWIVTNGRPHESNTVVIGMDIRDFFGSTTHAEGFESA